MPFILRDDKHFLNQSLDSRYHITQNISEATRWRNITKANNVLATIQTTRGFKDYHFKVERVEANGGISAPEAEPACSVKNLGLSEDLQDSLQEIQNLVEDLIAKRAKLIKEISDCDKRIVDIEHAAEFYQLNAAQGYKVYKRLHEVRNRRRKCKSELQIVELAFGNINRRLLITIDKNIKYQEQCKYTPRLEKELFESLNKK